MTLEKLIESQVHEKYKELSKACTDIPNGIIRSRAIMWQKKYIRNVMHSASGAEIIGALVLKKSYALVCKDRNIDITGD